MLAVAQMVKLDAGASLLVLPGLLLDFFRARLMLAHVDVDELDHGTGVLAGGTLRDEHL